MDNQETNQTTGRFHIGQEVYVIATIVDGEDSLKVDLKSKDGKDPIIHFKKLVVTEHHKVAKRDAPYDGNNFDGYVLTDGDYFYFNQYPLAAYGRMFDPGDSLFTMQPCRAPTLADYIASHDDRVKNPDSIKNPIFWHSITDVYTNLRSFDAAGRSDDSIASILANLREGFEKAFPGKTLVEKKLTAPGSEIIYAEVADK